MKTPDDVWAGSRVHFSCECRLYHRVGVAVWVGVAIAIGVGCFLFILSLFLYGPSALLTILAISYSQNKYYTTALWREPSKKMPKTQKTGEGTHVHIPCICWRVIQGRQQQYYHNRDNIILSLINPLCYRQVYRYAETFLDCEKRYISG